MKTLILAAIRCSLMFTAVTASLFSVRPAQGYTVTLEQVASDVPNGVPAKVVANGCGAINLTGLSQLGGSQHGDAHIKAIEGEIVTGPNGASFDVYNANTGPHPITGPHDFGGGGSSLTADAGSGDSVGIHFLPNGELVVPLHYVSGNALRSSATWNNKTFATLGVHPAPTYGRGGLERTRGSSLSSADTSCRCGGIARPAFGRSAFLLLCSSVPFYSSGLPCGANRLVKSSSV
jgi:hypothetical protein